MRIAVWRTGHHIADTVASALHAGLDQSVLLDTSHITRKAIESYDAHIGYGILRGMADVFRLCDVFDRKWFNVDRGYWHPGHFNGYYRVSRSGTQQTHNWCKLDYARYDALGIKLEPFITRDGCVLVCPPTEYVDAWLNPKWRNEGLIRDKQCTRLLDDDLARCRMVKTFNSAVGWEALRRGIPVESDSVYSIVGAWQKKNGDINKTLDTRRELFAIMASMQWTLQEIKSGVLNESLHRF